VDPRYKHHDKLLPEWFEEPFPLGEKHQLTLFESTLYQELANAAVSIDEARRWKASGWISFDVDSDKSIRMADDPRIAELYFVRDVARSGLMDTQIQCLLSSLPKPYAYNCRRIAFSLHYGWVMPTWPESVDTIVRENMDSWLDGLSRDELCVLMNKIDERIDALDTSEDVWEDDEEGEGFVNDN
jgi:hypothetical protein